MGINNRLKFILAWLRGLYWMLHPGVQASGVPLISGPRCILVVESGGKLLLGKHCQFDRDVEIVVYTGGTLSIGDYVYVGHGSTIACACSIQIDTETMIGDLVSIRDMNHRRLAEIPLRKSGIEKRPIKVGSNCWLGSKSTLVAGISLGDDVTVASNAVVTRTFNNGVILGGVPASVIYEDIPCTNQQSP